MATVVMPIVRNDAINIDRCPQPSMTATGGMVSMLRHVTLFKRLPSLRLQPRLNEQIVDLKTQAEYSALSGDFKLLEKYLLPSFQELDNNALGAQNQFRLEQVLLFFGGALASMIGAIQAAAPDFRALGIAEAVLAAGLTVIAWRARAQNAQKIYFTKRLKAEVLRSEYFLFLGRVGSYANDSDRVQQLIRRVADIAKEEA